jgi:phosphotransferase system  glucose/maltose/N-acetylglucosamine-specific IIC component
MVTIDYSSQEGGEAYSMRFLVSFCFDWSDFPFFLLCCITGEKVPNWVFYPAGLLFMVVLFFVFRVGMAYMKDVREANRLEAERLAKKAQKKVDKSRVPIAGIKKSPK